MVTQMIANDEMERYMVRAANHTFLLDTNRPAMIKANQGHLQWEWKLVGGVCPGYFLKEITNEIRRVLMWIDKI